MNITYEDYLISVWFYVANKITMHHSYFILFNTASGKEK